MYLSQIKLSGEHKYLPILELGGENTTFSAFILEVILEFSSCFSHTCTPPNFVYANKVENCSLLWEQMR